MDTFLAVTAIVLSIAGLAGCIVPMLPGPPISYVAMLLAACMSASSITGVMLVTFLLVTVAVTAADYFLPAWLARRFGGSRAGVVGATVGMVAGFFILPPIGIVLGPFLGAVIGELTVDRSDTARALRVGFGAFLSFVVGTGIKLAASAAMLVCIWYDVASVIKSLWA